MNKSLSLISSLAVVILTLNASASDRQGGGGWDKTQQVKMLGSGIELNQSQILGFVKGLKLMGPQVQYQILVPEMNINQIEMADFSSLDPEHSQAILDSFAEKEWKPIDFGQ